VLSLACFELFEVVEKWHQQASKPKLVYIVISNVFCSNFIDKRNDDCRRLKE